jgi:uncharacterized membrane protein
MGEDPTGSGTSPNWPSRRVRAQRRWTAGLLQLLCVAIGVGLGVLLPRIGGGPMVTTSRAVEVLGAFGFGVVGLVSIIFSLLFLVVQSSNTTFTPRLRLFEDDPWIWRTYAIALGLFAFSMSAFLAIGDAHGVSVIVPLLAFAAALAVIGLIRRILISAYNSLQLNSVIEKVFKTGRSLIVDLYPEPLAATGTNSHPAATPMGQPVRWTSPQATLEQFDLRRLVTEAERADSVVWFHVRVGVIIREGSTIATVQGDLTDDVVKSCCVVGANRTFTQDPLLAFRLLADIGLRALSPAVNDPATAVQAFDAVVGLLMLLASRDLAIGAITSPTGAVRVHLEMPSWSDFVGEGLDDLLAVAGTSPLMVQRVTATLRELAGETPQSRRSEVEARLLSIARATC